MIQQSLLSLLDDYRDGTQDPIKLLPALLAAARSDQHKCWISLIDDKQLTAYLMKLEGETPKTLPLYGIPFAVKDNIDLAGLPTTAACPGFSYEQRPYQHQRCRACLCELGLRIHFCTE